MARANSIFSISPDAFLQQITRPVEEKKLVITLLRCENLVASASTSSRDTYISVRLKERYHVMEPTNLRRPSPPTFRLKGGAFEESLERRPDSANTDDDGRGSSTTASTQSPSAHSPGRSTVAFDFLDELSDPVVDYIGETLQTKTVARSLQPNFAETLVFSHLASVPLVRRSSSSLLNFSHSSTGLISFNPSSDSGPRSNSLSSGSIQSGIPAALRKRKVDATFLVEFVLYDVSSSPGAGERFAEAEVNIASLVEGGRHTMKVPLKMTQKNDSAARRKSYLAAPDSIFDPANGHDDDDGAANPRVLTHEPPTLVVMFEPINVGTQRSNNKFTASEELLKALKEELSDSFGNAIIAEIHQKLLAYDDTGAAGLSRTDMCELLSELYYYTGTPIPDDSDVAADVDFLFAVFDKDRYALMDVSQICTMLKVSAFATNLKPKWRKAGSLSTVVTAASMAGALWQGVPPPPLQYPGFRRVDGHVVENTRRPPETATSKLQRYTFKEDIRESDALLARSEPGSEPIARLNSRASFSQNKDLLDESLVTPISSPLTAAAGLRRTSAVPPVGSKLNRVFGETLDHLYLEHLELATCRISNCCLVSCRLVSGTVVGGWLESCETSQGCDIRQLNSCRTSMLKNSRLTDSVVVNCVVFQSELVDCQRVMQSTVTDTKLIGTCRFTYCNMKDTTFRGESVKDEGGNLLERCKAV